MSNKFGYAIGYFFGWVTIYGLYALGIVGVVISLTNHEIPFIPLMFMMMVYILRKVIQTVVIFDQLGKAMTNVSITDKFNSEKKESDLDKMMNRINKIGGSN